MQLISHDILCKTADVCKKKNRKQNYLDCYKWVWHKVFKKHFFKTLLQIELHHDSKWNKPAEEEKTTIHKTILNIERTEIAL